jgi:hypothetical protein
MHSGERQIPPSLSFGSCVCVCAGISNNPEFFEHYCVPMRCKLYISPCPIYFKHNLQHIVASRNYNYIVWKGANDFSTLIFWTLPNLAKSIFTVTTWANTQNWGTKKTLLWVWTSVVVRFWLVLWLRVGEGACLN